MKAVRLHRLGGPEVLQYEEAPEPTPGPRDVVIRVRACALNHLDLWVRRRLAPRLPHIPGCDVAGDVAAVGELVTWLKPGDPVFINPGFSCGTCPECLAGRDNACRGYGVVGEHVDGGYAEYVRVPATSVYPKPAHLSYVEAAAMPLVFLTAWNMLFTGGNLHPGDTVLVLGAGSGVGSAAIQIAKRFGAYVIATAGSDEKLARARALGADAVIHHGQEDIREAVRRLTGKRGVDIVFEHVGEATWEASYKSLATRGRLVTCGATTGPNCVTDVRYVFSRQLRIQGTLMGTQKEFRTLLRYIEAGDFRPVVDQVLPLAEARRAHEILEARQQFGKIVLEV